MGINRVPMWLRGVITVVPEESGHAFHLRLFCLAFPTMGSGFRETRNKKLSLIIIPWRVFSQASSRELSNR